MAQIKKIKLNGFEIGSKKLTIMAGPCAIESKDILFKTADYLRRLTEKLDINYIFKSSFDKANRSSINSYRGPGIERGLELLEQVKREFELPIVTDIHLPEQAAQVAEVADIIQIPAFLCRQTDILVAAAKTGKIVNIKKGQFLAPAQMASLAKKVSDSGNEQILLTDRGVSFGYNNLVSDMRAIPIMREIGYPVVFDATHSVQLPGGGGDCSSGERKFVETLAKSAVAAGADALFFEIHPDPDRALCDGPNMLSFEAAEVVFDICNKIYKLAHKE